MQLIKVISNESKNIEALLYCYEDEKLILGPFFVHVGKKGITLDKVEGDKKSPVGTFRLGPIFGDRAHMIYAKKMDYLLITDELECVDDPNSIYYNQFIYKNQIEVIDWKSSEKMNEIGELYSLGVVVQYNQNPTIAFKGSAIFMHNLCKESYGTQGCIGVSKSDLKKIVSWLDETKFPHITINSRSHARHQV
ncbi:MAG: hypothetical protein FJZ59_01805 [Chlamydiae bacterium]|nr:hypothetical protein [Chlamydiota bacterium]